MLRLTSIFFRCRPGTNLTDAAGPLAGLALGLTAAGLVHLRRGGPPRAGTTGGVYLAAICLFWFFGQLARDGLMGLDDWAFLARRIGPAPLGLAGIVGYAATMLWLAGAMQMLGCDGHSLRRRLFIPFVAGLASAMAAGALWAGHRALSAREALLTLGVAPLGYLWAARTAIRRKASSSPGQDVVARDGRWILAALLIFAAFAWIEGRGLGPAA